MRIERREKSPEAVRRLQMDLLKAAAADGVAGRVCGPGCTATCPKCGSSACQCRCAPDCPDAPHALSSDPDAYPIEGAILPLVFEMKRLGMFRPCWSCEGHLGPDGTLWKLPRVWFYSESTVHVRLLSDGLSRLRHGNRLHADWRVIVTFSDPDNPDTTFSLEPAAFEPAEVTLAALQDDVREIARSLRTMITGEARRLQREAEV